LGGIELTGKEVKIIGNRKQEIVKYADDYNERFRETFFEWV